VPACQRRNALREGGFSAGACDPLEKTSLLHGVTPPSLTRNQCQRKGGEKESLHGEMFNNNKVRRLASLAASDAAEQSARPSPVNSVRELGNHEPRPVPRNRNPVTLRRQEKTVTDRPRPEEQPPNSIVRVIANGVIEEPDLVVLAPPDRNLTVFQLGEVVEVFPFNELGATRIKVKEPGGRAIRHGPTWSVNLHTIFMLFEVSKGDNNSHQREIVWSGGMGSPAARMLRTRFTRLRSSLTPAPLAPGSLRLRFCCRSLRPSDRK